MAAAPSPLVALSIVAVAMAGLAYVATDEPQPDERLTTVSRPATPTPAPSPTARPEPTEAPEKKKVEPAVRMGAVFLEIYNNSGITGLAGDTATKASGAGWQVVGSDNWVGTIPASTVYYPQRLREAARLLARDLGIERTKLAVAPMRFDRLTVILTADYA